MATFKDLHIENSINYKRWYYSAAHWLCVNTWLELPFSLWYIGRPSIS